VLPTRELSGTGIVTSPVGFGCAGLFRVPPAQRLRPVSDVVYDVGIRQFDVAPMYGLDLGRGAELASFLKRRREDVTVTAMFGIDPRLLTRGAALFQGLLPVFLAKGPNFEQGLKVAGRGAVQAYLVASFIIPGTVSTRHRSGWNEVSEIEHGLSQCYLLHDSVGASLPLLPR
jgi:hypothetical protein